MCILKIEKCRRCDTMYMETYRCIVKLLELHKPPCDTGEKIYNISAEFVCIVCILEEQGEEGVTAALQHLETEHKLKKESLYTTGDDSYTAIM